MLFELSGIAKITKVIQNSPEYVTLQLSFRDTKTIGENTRYSSGSRFISLTREQSAQILSSELSDWEGSIINVTATASNDSNGNRNFENYKAKAFQILGDESLEHIIENKEMFLRGTGKIQLVEVISENLSKVLVSTSERQGNRDVVCNRWLNLTGKAAAWYRERKSQLLGQSLQFKAKATTATRNGAGGTEYFKNYNVTESDVIWVQAATS